MEKEFRQLQVTEPEDTAALKPKEFSFPCTFLLDSL